MAETPGPPNDSSMGSGPLDYSDPTVVSMDDFRKRTGRSAAFSADSPVDDGGLNPDAIPLDKAREIAGLPPLERRTDHPASPYFQNPEPTVRSAEVTGEPPEEDPALNPPVTSREDLNRLVGTLNKSPEIVDQRLSAGMKAVNELLGNTTVTTWYEGHPYDPRAVGEQSAGGVEKYKAGIQAAVEAAKRGELGSTKLLWGQASGDVRLKDNARGVIEHIGSKLLRRSNFHGLTDLGRSRLAETIKLRNPADEKAVSEDLLRAMAIGGDHTVGIENQDGRSRDLLAPVIGDDGQPTGMWLKVGSGAFTDSRYNPNQSYVWGMELLIPPHGETPTFTDVMREEALRPLQEKQDAFKRYMDTTTTTVMPPEIAPMNEFGARIETNPTTVLHGGGEVTVDSHTLIDAGEQEFVLDWSPDKSSATLTNEKLRRHLWHELKNTHVELPYDEQKGLTDKIAQMTASLTSVQLEVGKPVVIGRDVEGPRLKTDLDLSRQHFSVELQPDGSVKITDLASTNGTNIFNDELAKQSKLITETPWSNQPETPQPQVVNESSEAPEPKRRGFLRRKR